MSGHEYNCFPYLNAVHWIYLLNEKLRERTVSRILSQYVILSFSFFFSRFCSSVKQFAKVSERLHFFSGDSFLTLSLKY